MKRSLFYLVLCFLPISSYADPLIENVTGFFSGGSSVTIYGNGFGQQGPNVIIFDDFFRGSSSEFISLNATTGMWSQSGSPKYSTDSNGNVNALLIEEGTSNQLIVDFPPSTDAFLSYRVLIPTGYHFPYSFQPGTFSDGSNWKLAWLMDGATGYENGENDIVLPTYPFGRFTISGNAGVPRREDGSWSHFDVGSGAVLRDDTMWFSFNGWNRFSAWLKGGVPDPTVNAGGIWAQGMSDEYGQKQFGADGDNERVIHSYGGQWTRLAISGWHRSGGDTNIRAAYDDIYLATGDNAAARVEIGNADVYSKATKLAVSTPERWTDSELTITVRSGGFVEGDTIYLFVIDKDNIPSLGYGPYVLGNEASNTEIVMPSPLLRLVD